MRPFSHTLALGMLVRAIVCLANPTASTEASELGHLIDACYALSKLLPGSVNFPNSTTYIKQNIYWSERQSEVHPRCFVTPRKTSDVSVIMKTLTALKAPFTVKCGGHTAFAGGSNIAGGVTIDLLRLNEIAVAYDRKTVSVGSGNRWINVSLALDPMGLAVIGGRVGDVGVAGLILGGGISYFSGKYGWACDNVRNFEIVLASGQVVNASAANNPDLYWGLRGGSGSNFGIVTRFDLAAFPQGDLWTSSLIYPGTANKTLIALYTDLSQKGLVEDHDAHTWFVMTYADSFGGFVTAPSFFHAIPPPENTIPRVFQPFQSVPGALQNTTGVKNISAQSIAIEQAYGSRQTWWDTSVGLSSPELLEEIIALWEAHVLKIVDAAKGTEYFPFLIFQPVTQNVIEAMQKNGGNALGLKPQDGPLMIVQLSSSWEEESLDSLIEQGLKKLVDEIEGLAKRKGLYRGFVYMNYAGKDQDVLERYGPESYARLKATVRKWDPKGDLQKLWKGYFQVERNV